MNRGRLKKALCSKIVNDGVLTNESLVPLDYAQYSYMHWRILILETFILEARIERERPLHMLKNCRAYEEFLSVARDIPFVYCRGHLQYSGFKESPNLKTFLSTIVHWSVHK